MVIVFVHGLGSNPDTTWRSQASPGHDEPIPESERFVNWVSDFLPDDLQTAQRNIRMVFYNYHTYWKRDALDLRLETLGKDFLAELYSKIYASEIERRRHLIFVAHSHGGLVVKKALVRARLSSEFESILKSTKLILFLGSPHSGTMFGTWGWVLAQALRPLGSNQSILVDLEYDSVPLRDLHINFCKAIKENMGMKIISFYEERPTTLLRIWFLKGQEFMALDYALRNKDRYNPILWLDARNEESMRSSFKRCATELQAQVEHVENQGSVFEDPAVQAVNRWLRDRSEADDQWLVLVDNSDDIQWGVKKIIPKGQRGYVIITSQDSLDTELLRRGCERIRIDVLSPTEAATLLLKHLKIDADSASEETRRYCNEVVQKLGYLALAIDIAGACIGNEKAP
ncbi:hypothetical protein LZ31DRAFT_600019 [Colletotrichum somersetense]|nr:hypothetical protein LZ31DRAFT_600019 [Colletotrichum somersetense]